MSGGEELTPALEVGVMDVPDCNSNALRRAPDSSIPFGEHRLTKFWNVDVKVLSEYGRVEEQTLNQKFTSWKYCRISAAEPLAIGVAIEVPDFGAVVHVSLVDEGDPAEAE